MRWTVGHYSDTGQATCGDLVPRELEHARSEPFFLRLCRAPWNKDALPCTVLECECVRHQGYCLYISHKSNDIENIRVHNKHVYWRRDFHEQQKCMGGKATHAQALLSLRDEVEGQGRLPPNYDHERSKHRGGSARQGCRR